MADGFCAASFHGFGGRDHRRIAYIHGADSAVTKSRLASFYRTAEELGLTIPDEYVVEAAYHDTAEVNMLTRKLLELKEPPSCILFPDDFAAFGGVKAIVGKGLRIPEDVSVAGYDGIDIGKYMEPQLTTWNQDAETIGRLAGEALIRLIEKPRTTLIETIMVDGSLFEGEAVREWADVNKYI